MIKTHDLGNLLPMMDQYDKVLRSGVLYPRWTPEWNKGYGTATFNFYPPCLFYLTTLIHAVLHDWVDTVFLISALSLAASGLAFYFLARTFYSRLASSIAALVYMLLPFHQVDLYWRGAVTEFVGYVFLPLVIYFAYKLGTEGGARYYAALGFTHGLYLMTHLPVSYIFTYVLVFYALLWSFREKNFRILVRLAGGIALALLFSAIYWLPAALEARYAFEWVTQTFPYHQTYISLAPVIDPFTQLIQEIFTFHAIALITVIVVLSKIHRPATINAGPAVENDNAVTRAESQTRMWVILGIATIFMTTSFSIYVSKLIPKIQLAVPPFRWLAIASLFLALLAAACVDRLRVREESRSALLLACRIAVGVAIALNLWLTVHGIMISALSNPTHEVVAQYEESGAIPKDATSPNLLPDTALAVITPEPALSEVIQWLPTSRAVAVRVDQPSQLRLKTYNFPGWTARIDGNVVPMLSDKDGVQQVEVPAGIHVVRATFENTPPRTAGTLLSCAGVLLILGLGLAGRARQPRSDSDIEPENAALERGSASVIASTAKRRNRISLKALGLIGVVVIISAAIVMMTTSRFGSRNTPPPGGGSTDKPAIAASRAPGSETHLYLPGQDSVLVAVDEKALDQALTALSSRDSSAVDALVESGRLLRVANNTLTRVLEIGSGKTRVRILEGEHVMVDGWVPERWLR